MAGIGRAKGSPRVPGSGRKKGTIDAKHSPLSYAMRELKFDPMEELIRMHDRLTEMDERLAGANSYYDGADLLVSRKESICKTLLPYIHSRKAQEVVQHNINTDVPDVSQARDAVLKAMTKLQKQ